MKRAASWLLAVAQRFWRGPALLHGSRWLDDQIAEHQRSLKAGRRLGR